MSDLKTQLRQYLDETAPPVEHEDVIRRIEVGSATPAKRTTFQIPGWLYAVAAAAAVMLLIGGLAWLIGPGPAVDPADTVVPTTLAGTVVPSTLAESAPTTEVVSSGEFVVTWTRAQWDEGEGPRLFDIVAAPSLLLGTDDLDLGGRLWRSSDGVNWEPLFSELTDVSVAADGPFVLIGGLRSDGTRALLRSSDGENWTEVDYSAFPGTNPTVVEVTQSGFVELFDDRGPGGSGEEVFGLIVGDQLLEIHEPPWDVDLCCTRQLVETSNGITAFQGDFNDPRSSNAWSYLGNGEWSGPVEIPISSDHARVGDTILMFDQTNATCCENPIPGTSLWPLLASEDGITWTELSKRPAENVHSLEIEAGDSFWVYGPQIGGGGSGIEIDSSTTIWISGDGFNWEPIDAGFASDPSFSGFVQVAGDTIFIGTSAFEETGTYWVGTVSSG